MGEIALISIIVKICTVDQIEQQAPRCSFKQLFLISLKSWSDPWLNLQAQDEETMFYNVHLYTETISLKKAMSWKKIEWNIFQG